MDPSAGVLWLLAVSTAVAAALWAGSDYAFEARQLKCSSDDEVQSSAGPGPQPNRAPIPESTGILHTRQSAPFAPLAGPEVKGSLKIHELQQQKTNIYDGGATDHQCQCLLGSF